MLAFLKRLLDNGQGIIAVAIIGSLVMVMGTILWLIAIVPIVMFSNMLPSMGLAMPPQEHTISSMNLVAAGVVEILIIVGPLIWIFVSASRKEQQGYPM